MPKDTSAGSGTVGPAETTLNYLDYQRIPYHIVLSGLDATTSGAGAGLFASYGAGLSPTPVMEALTTAQATSPFDAVTAYAPDTVLNSMQDRVTAFLDAVDDMDSEVDTESALEFAVTYYDDTFDTESEITTLTDQFETRGKNGFLREVGRVAAGYFDIRGVQGSQMGADMAMMEADRRIEVSSFDAQNRMQSKRQRMDMVMGLTNHVLAEKAKRLQALQSGGTLQGDATRTFITAKQDQVVFDLDTEVRDALWPLELFPYFYNGLAAIQGAVTVPRAQTQRERVMTAVLNSSSLAFQVGAAGGGPAGGAAAGILSLGAQLYGAGVI